jgi:hypothetical protein
VLTGFNNFNTAAAVAIQSDGKIVVAGLTSASSDSFAISRSLPGRGLSGGTVQARLIVGTVL